MLSNKMTVSLMSLITILVFAFMASTAMGAVLGDGFETKVTLSHANANADTDDPPDGADAGPRAAPYTIADNVIESNATAGTTGVIRIKVEFAKRVRALMDQAASGNDPAVVTDGSEDAFTAQDITVTIKNQNGDEIELTAGHPLFTILDTENADADNPETYTPATPATLLAGKVYYVDLGDYQALAFGAENATGVITVEVKVLANRVKNDDLNDRIQASQNPGDMLGYNAEGSLKFTIVPRILLDPRLRLMRRVRLLFC